jgi:hypothetical protein
VNFGVNLKYLPVQELVEMIHSERERTAAVDRELKQVHRLSRASDHELRVAKEEALQELTRVQNLALVQKLESDKQVKMAEEETRRAVDVATRLRAC